MVVVWKGVQGEGTAEPCGPRGGKIALLGLQGMGTCRRYVS